MAKLDRLLDMDVFADREDLVAVAGRLLRALGAIAETTVLAIGLVGGVSSVSGAHGEPWNQVNQVITGQGRFLVLSHEFALGQHRGRRLPSIQELESLTDATQSSPALPVGSDRAGSAVKRSVVPRRLKMDSQCRQRVAQTARG